MKNLRFVPIVSLIILLAGCASLFTGVVTMTTVTDATLNMWADLSVRGQTTPELDAKVATAHNAYRASCSVVKSALVAYKVSGDPAQYQAALDAAKQAAQKLLDLIAPLILPADAASLQTKLNKAKTI